MDIGIALLMTQHDFNTIDLARRVEELGFVGTGWALMFPLRFDDDPSFACVHENPEFLGFMSRMEAASKIFAEAIRNGEVSL